MKHLVVVAGVWLGCDCCLAAPGHAPESTESSARPAKNTAATTDPPQAFIATTKAELGEVRRGQLVPFEFTIENRGRTALEITSKPNCGCTVVDHDKVIPPGQQRKLKAELRTSNLRGEFHKSILVETNDPAHRSIPLVLTGRVIEAVELVPARIPTMILKMDEPAELEIALRTVEQVEITGVTCALRYVQARIEPNGDRAYRLLIAVDDAAPVGRSNFELLLATTSEFERVIPITISCTKGIEVIPPTFGFGNVQRGTGFAASTVVVRRAEGGLHIRTASSNNPDLEVMVAEVKDGLYRLTATYRGDLANLGARSVVTVETDDTQQPKLQIPIKSPQRSSATKPETR